MKPEFKNHKTENRSNGFTLVELMATVAIIILVGLVAFFSISELRLSLRQKEMDSKAELIYVAAQNRISELRAAGCEALYQSKSPGVNVMSDPPSDADEDSKKNVSFCYVLAETKAEKELTAMAAILPSYAVDRDLWDGQWCIEYDPVSGSIYAVFYSEEDLPEKGRQDLFRSFDFRRKKGKAKVGYYGGDIVQIQDTGELQPSVSIENGEKLTATFYCNRPTDSPISMKIQISDGENTYTKDISQGQLNQFGSKMFRYTWVLDDLTRSSTRFYAQTEGKLKCGVPLTVTLTVNSEDPLVDRASVTRKTNGLFDDRTDYDVGSATALISCGRHLQNLDESSHVATTVVKAMQISDISFYDDETDDKDWYSYYGAAFTPISNDRLVGYTAISELPGEGEVRSTIYGLNVSASAKHPDVGLFGSFAGRITGVSLTGVKAYGGSGAAGALVGKTTGKLTITDSRVYLSSRLGETDGLTSAAAADVPAQISGSAAGGLVGDARYDITVENSFAATVVGGTSVAGGLVGHTEKIADITNSYADCYLKAPSTGGLVGDASDSAVISLENVYAAGYQTATEKAAGFVPATVESVRNSYSVCAFFGDDALRVYTTAAAVSGNEAAVENVYYLRDEYSADVNANLPGTESKSYHEFSNVAFVNSLSASFEQASVANSHPYNLLNQGLSTYSYPKLKNCEHFGDWQAEFEADALVYYEVYADGTYGFFGGNTDCLAPDDGSVVVGDGYAVALEEEPENGWVIKIQCGEKIVALNSDGAHFTVVNKGKTYYLFPLPKELTAIEPTGNGADFYQKITVGTRVYYYNPFFSKTVTTSAVAPDTVFVRTARHLYALSKFYPAYAEILADSTFLQERNIDYTLYRWGDYSLYTTVTEQAPIDSNGGFATEYDGANHTITGVNISSSGLSVGLFGTVTQTGRVKNLSLIAKNNGYIRIERIIDGSTVKLYAGTLAGRNYGIISNCAVDGYEFVGQSRNSAFGITAYNYSILHVGGFVGANFASGRGKNGTLGIFSSEANISSIIVSGYSATVYAGGFAGANIGGNIQSCYALGVLYAKDVSHSTVWLCGFAGDNNSGILRYCYSATALTAAGKTEIYGLTRVGGGAVESYYLNGGTYSYLDNLYPYNTAGNSFSVNAAGKAITGAEFEKLRLPGFSTAQRTVYGGTNNYPYPAIVRSNGTAKQVTHYGDWPTLQHIGTLGVFYWEYESGGSSGYHISYLGTDNGYPIKGGSLCTQHDDGGSVTRFGYGYFYQNDTIESESNITWTHANCVEGNRQSDVEAVLATQMKGYSFVAYETGPVKQETATGSVTWSMSGTMYLTSEDVNSTWTLSYAGNVYTYSVCPFFADAIAYKSAEIGGFVSQTGSLDPGTTDDNPYQIRSVAQLQNINWNYGKLNATSSIVSKLETVPEATWSMYPYLVRYQPASTSNTKDNKWNNSVDNPMKLISDTGGSLRWEQSHDVDSYAESGNTVRNFTPIGSLFDYMEIKSNRSKPFTAFFGGSYDGMAYTIRNIEIHSSVQCIGMFGITSGAKLKNIIMYSDRNSEIECKTDGTNWYTLGGLVGFAGSRNDPESLFTNCTVSGYKITDNRRVDPGWGGGCVGGLVGATNMEIYGCSAVSDIVLNLGYTSGFMNQRTGGIAGVSRSVIDKCYAGGTIKSISSITQASSPKQGTSIWIGGITGGIMLRYEGGFSELVGKANGNLKVKNCYSFVKVPPDGSNLVRTSHAIASNGESQSKCFTSVANMEVFIDNCYALDQTSLDANDYKIAKNTADSAWSDKVNLNGRPANDQNAKVTITNHGKKPFISYTEMQTVLKDWLNETTPDKDYTPKVEKDFQFVTVTENGARIDGKYSFPGLDADRLEGLNYPFPTILTQKDAFNRTVNVHYGTWPMYGIYWERSSVLMDLFANRGDSGKAPSITVALYPVSDAIDTSKKPTITLLTEEGLPADETIIAQNPVISDYNATEKCWRVEFVGAEAGVEGVVVAKAEIDGMVSELPIRVGTVLSLGNDKPDGMTVYYMGPVENVTLSLRDVNGNPVTANYGGSGKIEWSISAEQLSDGTAIVECDANDIVPVADSPGDFTLPMKGFAEGDSAVTVSCTYIYTENGQEKRVTASSIISVHSYRDAVGVVYDLTDDPNVPARNYASGVYLPYEGEPESTDEITVTVPSFDRDENTLYIFAGNGYTNLTDFTFDLSGLYALDTEGNILDKGWGLYPGNMEISDQCKYYRISVITDENRRAYINGKIKLVRGSTEYIISVYDFPVGGSNN